MQDLFQFERSGDRSFLLDLYVRKPVFAGSKPCRSKPNIQIFARQSENLEKLGGRRKAARHGKYRCSRLQTSLERSEPYQDAAAKGTALAVELDQSVIARYTCAESKEVSSVDHGFGMEGQAHRGKVLRNQDAQARVIDRQTALERVDGEYCCLGRQSEDRLDACPGLEVGLELSEEGLERGVLEKVGRV